MAFHDTDDYNHAALDQDERALSGDDPDDQYEGETSQAGAQDAPDDRVADDTERGGSCRHDAPQAEAGQAWQIVMAERDDGGLWRTVGDPVPGYVFSAMGDATNYANQMNQRVFGRRFD